MIGARHFLLSSEGCTHCTSCQMRLLPLDHLARCDTNAEFLFLVFIVLILYFLNRYGAEINSRSLELLQMYILWAHGSKSSDSKHIQCEHASAILHEQLRRENKDNTTFAVGSQARHYDSLFQCSMTTWVVVSFWLSAVYIVTAAHYWSEHVM